MPSGVGVRIVNVLENRPEAVNGTVGVDNLQRIIAVYIREYSGRDGARVTRYRLDGGTVTAARQDCPAARIVARRIIDQDVLEAVTGEQPGNCLRTIKLGRSIGPGAKPGAVDPDIRGRLGKLADLGRAR